MNRAFISLYLIIVLSVVLLGLIFNKFWEEFDPAPEADPAVTDLFQLVEGALIGDDFFSQEQSLKQISSGLDSQFNLLHLSDFAKNKTAESIKNGQVVSAGDEHFQRFYHRVKNTDLVIGLVRKNPEHNFAYVIFIVVFYAAIAIAIFLWVWPLSRDLALLAEHTRRVGKDGQAVAVKLSPHSAVFSFANAFNQMANRLNSILRSQKEMTYAVSHELRTPLARMKFALAMLESQKLSEPVRKQLLNIHRDAVEMEELISALLAYASFEQQDRELQQRPGHMQDLLQEIIARLQAGKPDNIYVEVRDLSGGEVFYCEWSLMQTVIQNLLDNARSFAHSRIIVSLTTSETEFQLSVEDDGPGVPAQDRERVFESFVRLYSDAGKERPSGFGLGLAIVKRILNWHGGAVSCANSVLGGALFSIRWPKSNTLL